MWRELEPWLHDQTTFLYKKYRRDVAWIRTVVTWPDHFYTIVTWQVNDMMTGFGLWSDHLTRPLFYTKNINYKGLIKSMYYIQQDQTIYYIWVRNEILELVDFVWFLAFLWSRTGHQKSSIQNRSYTMYKFISIPSVEILPYGWNTNDFVHSIWTFFWPMKTVEILLN